MAEGHVDHSSVTEGVMYCVFIILSVSNNKQQFFVQIGDGSKCFSGRFREVLVSFTPCFERRQNIQEALPTP